MDWTDFYDLVVKGFLSGAVSYITQMLLKRDQRELEELQSKPPESTDIDKEELLTHYLATVADEVGDTNELTVRESVKVIKSRTGVFATYWYLKVQRLSTEGEKPKGV